MPLTRSQVATKNNCKVVLQNLSEGYIKKSLDGKIVHFDKILPTRKTSLEKSNRNRSKSRKSSDKSAEKPLDKTPRAKRSASRSNRSQSKGRQSESLDKPSTSRMNRSKSKGRETGVTPAKRRNRYSSKSSPDSVEKRVRYRSSSDSSSDLVSKSRGRSRYRNHRHRQSSSSPDYPPKRRGRGRSRHRRRSPSSSSYDSNPKERGRSQRRNYSSHRSRDVSSSPSPRKCSSKRGRSVGQPYAKDNGSTSKAPARGRQVEFAPELKPAKRAKRSNTVSGTKIIIHCLAYDFFL